MGRVTAETSTENPPPPHPPPPPEYQQQPSQEPVNSYQSQENNTREVPPSYYNNNNGGGGAANGVPLQGMPMMVPVPGQQVNGSVNKTANDRPWTTELFACMDDPTLALTTLCFPCVTFGQIADTLDNGHTTCVTSAIIYAVSPCVLSRLYRTKLRRRFGLMEAPAPDWIVHTFFEPCALCQEYRELRNRGLDPALGFHGNSMAQGNQQNANVAMSAPQNQMMNHNSAFSNAQV